MSMRVIKKVVIDNVTLTAIPSTSSGSVATVFIEWNGRKYAVEVSNEGVVVAPVGTDGEISKHGNPSVWVDPYVINDNEQLEEFDKGEAPLLVHSYFDNEQEAPVTVRCYKERATIGGDGLPFIKKP